MGLFILVRYFGKQKKYDNENVAKADIILSPQKCKIFKKNRLKNVKMTKKYRFKNVKNLHFFLQFPSPYASIRKSIHFLIINFNSIMGINPISTHQ